MSTLRAGIISDAAGTGPAELTGQWASRAFVYYDQTVPTTRASGNVSSVSDDGTGLWTTNFSSAFDGTTYSRNLSVSDFDSTNNASITFGGEVLSQLAGSMQQDNRDLGGTRADADRNECLWIGDLA